MCRTWIFWDGWRVSLLLQEHSKVEHTNNDLLFSNNGMPNYNNLFVHVLPFFGEIKVVSSFPKTKTARHKRMKQRLKGRKLRDRCKTFISDHLFQELPQDANNYLQNPQRGRSTLGGIFIRGMFLASVQSYLLELIECLGVLQWALAIQCFLYIVIHIIWSDKVKKSPTHNELECDLLLVDW